MQNHWEKRICLFGLLLFMMLQGYSQKYSKTYYDKFWTLTTKSLAYYSRAGFLDTLNYQYNGVVNDYYVATGKLQMTGNYLVNRKNGSFNFYYPDGTLKTEGFYKDNVRVGTWTNYYKNGRIRDKVLFDDNFVKALSYYDTNGVQKLSNGTGEWQTEYFNDYSFEYIQIEGNYLNSRKDGVWNFYARQLKGGILGELKLQLTEKYHKGKFVSGKKFWNDKILDQNMPKDNLIRESQKFNNTETWKQTQYACIEEYPFLQFLNKVDSTVFPVDSFATYQGGMDSVATAIWRGIKLPQSYIADNPTTLFFIDIIIDQNGKLSIKDEKSHSDVFYQQAIQSIRNLSDWKPAKRNSLDVINYFTIRFHEKDGYVLVDMMSMNELTQTFKSGITNYY